MSILQEVLAGVRRLDRKQPDDDETDMGLDASGEQDPALEVDDELPDDELSLDDEVPDDGMGDEMSLDDQDNGTGDDQHPELDGIADDATDDPDHQGLIRNVKNAHLVYKRETEDGAFEELWIYNVSTLKDELIVKKAILAGTDIPPNKMQSPDGSQSYELWSAGNAELLMIKGLPN